MSNEYYNGGTVPATASAGASAPIRSEFNAVTVGFDKLPARTGNAGKVLRVRTDESALEAYSATANAIFYANTSGQLVNSSSLVYTSTGRLGVGTSAPTVGLEVISGSVLFRSSNTPSTNNTTRLFLGSYAGNPLTALVGVSDSSANTLNIGGSTASGEPASSIAFYTGTAGALGSGTGKMILRSDGHLQLLSGTNLMAGTNASYSTISTITSSTTNDAFNPAISISTTANSISQGGYIGSRTSSGNQRQGLYVASQQLLTLWGDSTGDGAGVLDVISGTTPSVSADTSSLFRINSDGNVGIGEVAPTTPFYVKRSLNTVYSVGAALSGNMAFLHNNSTAAGGVYAGLNFFANGDTATGGSGAINLIHTGDGSGAFAIQTRNAGVYGERLRITSDGNLLVGNTSGLGHRVQFNISNPTKGLIGLFVNSATSSHTGAQVQITQNGFADWAIGQPAADGSFAFWWGRNPSSDGSERMRIDTAGRVLIGTTTTKQLAYSVDPRLQVEEASSTHGASIGTNVNTTSGSYLSFSKSRAGTLGGVTAVVDNDNLGGLRFQGANGTGFAVGAEILSLVDGTPSATSMPADLDFRTSPNTTVTPLSRMTISAEGLITMRAPTTGTTTLSVVGSSGGTFVGMSDGTVTGFINGAATGLNFGTTSAHAVRLYTNNVARFRIASDGSVGIGNTTSAGTTLYVNKDLTGATGSIGLYQLGTVLSDVTVAAYGYSNTLQTQNAAFTLPLYVHYYADEGTVGAGSTITKQAGFGTNTDLISATNNYGFWAQNTAAVTAGKTSYGFYSEINTATGGGTTWQMYMGGTANSYVGGNLLLGSAATANNLRLQQSFAIVGVNKNYPGLAITAYNGPTAALRGSFDFNRSRGTAEGSMTAVASGDYLGTIAFRGADGTAFSDGASIEAHVDGTVGTSIMPGRLVFRTSPAGASSLSERMRLDSNGYLLIGYTGSNGSYALQVNSQIFATNATIATSDGTYKENVTSLTGALPLIMALNPVQFDWKAHPVHNFDRSSATIGFIAQEVQTVLAGTDYVGSVVRTNHCVLPDETTEEFLGLAEGSMVPLLVAAIKELKAEFDAYKATHP